LLCSVFGVSLDRKLNGEGHQYYGPRTVTKNWTLYVHKNNWSEVFRKQILVMNIYYFTKTKLAIHDQNGVLIAGDDNATKPEIHKWRFETDPNNIQWILTDMDDFLLGNSYTH
jgi:hypothetical protein